MKVNETKSSALQAEVHVLHATTSAGLVRSLNVAEKAQLKVWITGVSGSGKNYVAEEVLGLKSTKIPTDSYSEYVDCDHFGTGEMVNGKRVWVINPPAGAAVYVGTADNVHSLLDDLGIDMVIWVRPSVSLYKATNAAKALTGPADMPAEWRVDFNKKARLSPSEIRKTLDNKFNLVLRHLKGTKVTLVIDYLNTGTPDSFNAIQSGWHGARVAPIVNASNDKRTNVVLTK